MEWNPDRVLAVIGIVLAIVLFMLGLGATLAMDAKTKTELRFAQSCFVVSALILMFSVGVWGMNTNARGIWRIIIVAVSFAIIGIGLVETPRWAKRRHQEASKEHEGTGASSALPSVEVPSNHGKFPTGSPNPSAKRHEVETPPSSTSIWDPIGHLNQLGWTVKNDKGDIQFEIANRSLPNMEQSAGYFRMLRKPFRLQFQQVPSIAGLSSLAGIGECVEIGISASDIEDLSELHVLKSLRKLNISQTPFTVRSTLDISPLASLVNLESLGLNMSRVSNIEPLRGLTKLVSLNIGGSLVKDLSPIKGLTLLKSVDVRDSLVTDVSALEGETALEELSIDEKQIPSLTRLSRLPNLHRLNIITQVPVDMTAVGTLSNLNFLFIWGPPFIDLSSLRTLAKLTNLQIAGFGFGAGLIQIKDPDAIGEFGQLTTLTLGDVQINSLRFLDRLNNLAELNLRHLPLGSISDLTNLASLKQISLVDIPIVDISPLLSLPNLAKLSLMRTPARADVIAQLERRGVRVSNP